VCLRGNLMFQDESERESPTGRGGMNHNFCGISKRGSLKMEVNAERPKAELCKVYLLGTKRHESEISE